MKPNCICMGATVTPITPPLSMPWTCRQRTPSGKRWYDTNLRLLEALTLNSMQTTLGAPPTGRAFATSAVLYDTQTETPYWLLASGFHRNNGATVRVLACVLHLLDLTFKFAAEQRCRGARA